MKKRAIILELIAAFSRTYSFKPLAYNSLVCNAAREVCPCKVSLSSWIAGNRKRNFMRVLSAFLIFVFSCNQIVFAVDANSYQEYRVQPIQSVTDADSVELNPAPSQTIPNTTTDFLLNADSPLSPTFQASPQNDPNKTFDPDGKLRTEITLDGHTIRHVYAEESIQTVIDSAVSGDTVYLHAGTYHAHLVLKDGVDLEGEDTETTVLTGDFQSGNHVIRALGNNQIEGLTITGGGPYSGMPSSAVRVEGDNVKIRNNQIINNQDYGIHIVTGQNTLIEMNFFKDTHLGVQLPNDTAVIRYNTFIHNDIAVNVLNGAKPRIENNIFTGSTFQSIYEFSWSAYASGQASRGFAIVENNTFFNNTERGSYYGSATPPAAETQTAGNQHMDPGFVDPAHGNYSILTASAAYGRGCYLPVGLKNALDRSSRIPASSTLRNILDGTNIIGYEVIYAEGSREQFYNDGRQGLDIVPPVLAILSTIVLTNQAAYTLRYTVEGIEHIETRTLVEGANTLMVEAADIFGNKATASFAATLDRTAPAGGVRLNSGNAYTNAGVFRIEMKGEDALSGLGDFRISLDGGATWEVWQDLEIRARTIYVSRSFPDGIERFSYDMENWHGWDETDELAYRYAIDMTLALGELTDGEYSFSVQFRDKAGNVSGLYQDTIIYDGTLPQGSIGLRDYPSNNYFYDFPLTLSLTATDSLSGVQKMRFSLDGGTQWTDWENYSAERRISLDEAKTLYDYYGTNTVRFMTEFKDQAGNVRRESFSSTRDGEFPQGTVSINGGAAYTNSREVTLDLTAHDSISGVRGMQIRILNSDHSIYSDTGLISFSTTQTVTLPEGDGQKDVQYWVCDWAACRSFSDSIILDTVAPAVVVTSSLPSLTNQASLVVNYTVDGAVKQKIFTLAEGDNAALTITEVDLAGNARTITLSNVKLDTKAPELGLLSDAYVYSSSYTLRYRISDSSMTTTTQQENVTLNRGWNTFTRQATDSLGHVREMTWRIYLDLNAERGQNFDYDTNGNVVRTTNFNGEDTLYAYDALNRLKLVTFPDGSNVKYRYDTAGNLGEMEDSRGITHYYYDIANRLSSIAFPDGKTIHYDLDNAGQLIGLRYAGRSIAYAYDVAGRLISVTEGGGGTTYAYNNAGDLTSTTLPNGIRTTNTYDTTGRLTDILHENISGAVAELVARFHYTLDLTGQKTQMIEIRPEGTRTVDYTYDEFGRLTQDIDSAYGTTHYTYDAAGNRLSMERIPVAVSTSNPRIVNQYTYGIDNRLVSMAEIKYDAGNVQLSSMTETYVYDAAGRMLQKITPDQVTYYEYDARGLLARVNDGENETTYEYDGLGNRIAKTVNGERTEYMVNIAQAIPQVLAEMDNVGVVTRSYKYGMGRLSQTDGTENQYFLSDALGSTIGLTTQAGATETTYQYSAFGNSLAAQTATAATPFLYAGEQLDLETGFMYLRARYYDPSMGRFISRDPQSIGELFQTQSFNPFIYVQNNPVNFVDPSGLIGQDLEYRVWDSYSGEIRDPNRSYEAMMGLVNAVNGPPLIMTAIAAAPSSLSALVSAMPYAANFILAHPQLTLAIASAAIKSLGNTESFTDFGTAFLISFFDSAVNGWANLSVVMPAGSPGVHRTYSNWLQNYYSNSDDAEVSNNNNNSGTLPPGGGGSIGGSLPGSANTGGNSGSFLGNLFSGIGSAIGSVFSGITGAVSSVLGGIASLFRGGVYMNKALDVVGVNINNVRGVTYDSRTGQIILLSETGANIPEIPVDYFLAALKAVFGQSQAVPGVSIDPPKDANGNYITDSPIHDVNFFGGVENTQLGKAIYDADYLMKKISDDKVEAAFIQAHIPGFKTLSALIEDSLRAQIENKNFNSEDEVRQIILNKQNSASHRMWFTPKQMDLIRSQDGSAFVFGDHSVELKSEAVFLSGQSAGSCPEAEAFTGFFNAHFSEFAELYPELKELEKAMRAVGLARFIADNNVPVDLNWLATASLPAVSTPTTTPSIRVDSSISIPFYINGQAGTTIATLNYSMQGGVDYNLVLGNNLSYSNDNGETAALGLSTQNSRPNDLTTAWNIQWGDSTLQATALSLAPTQKEGSFSWQDTDLSYGTTGDFGLSFQRYYDSFLATDKTALGYGWANVPYELDFPVANASKTFSDGAGGSVVVSIPPKILFTDWANHQLLEFTPHQRQGDGHIIYAPKDNKITRELFVLNPDGSYIYRRDGQEIFFNAAGILQSLKDRNGNQISYIYDIQGKLARIKDVTSAREITLTYDGLGRVSTVLGPDGRSVQYVYDAATGNLKTVTCGWTGRTTTFEYNADHQLTKAIDYAGRVMFVNAFDGIGRLTSQTNFLGNQTQLSSNLLSQGTAVTSSATGTQGGWQYNSNFQLITGTDALGNQVHYTYGDNLFGPVSATDSFGNTTYYAYDEFGNVKEMTDVFGNKTKYYYNRVAGDNRPLFIEKTNGRGTAYSYDVHGNLSDVYEGARISNIAGDGTITIEYTNVHTHMEYDAQGRLIAQTDPEGRTTHYEYDNAGHVTSITDGMGHQATTTYVQRNGVVTNLISQMTDAIGRSVQYVYDSVTDLLTSVTTSTGTIHYGYDSLDRLNLIRDENGHESELVYNDKNQLISTINRSASGHVEDNLRVNYSYDALGRLIAMTGPMGAATGFIYDLLSRIKRVVISEPVPSYGAVGSLSIENVKTDQADLAFTAGTGLSQVVVRYRANGEVNYRQIVIDHPVTGDNKLTLQGLTEKTKYEVELELKDNDGHTSYSRKYQFETKQTQPPVIDSLVARDIAEQNANIRLSVSKEISEISLAFHVLGETTTKVIRVEGLQSGSIDVDLEELRIGMTYSVDVIVKDAQGRQSLLKNVQFKMLGTPSSEETVNYREAEARYGAILGATGTMALLSIENPNVSNPGAEHYLVTLSDDQGHTPPPGAYIAGIYQSSTFGMYLYLAGLTPNTHYNYMLTNVNRLDILAVGGEFRTGDPADTIWPATSGGGYRNRDSQSLVFYRRLTEDLSTMKITLTDQATQGQKTYWFFHVPGEQYTEFLLDGLSAGHSYAASWTIVDMSGHVSSGYSTDIMVVEEAKDEIPPQVVERVVTQKTATMAALHVTTNELLRKLKVQYRVTGTEEWFEQNVVRTDNAFDVVLENLQAGASYQYRYVLEDMDGNQLVAAWENLALQNLAAGPMAAALKTNLAVLNATETSTNGMFINGQEIHNISSVDLALVSFEADASFELKMDNGKTPAAGKDPGSFVGTSKYRLSNTAFQFASAPVTSPVSSADLLAESPAFLAKPRDLSGVVMEAEVGQKTQKMHNRKKGHAAAKLYNVDRVGGLNLTNKMSLLGKDLTAALLSDDITGERYGRWLDGK